MNKKIIKRARGRPCTGTAMTAAERMRRLRARRKQAGLRAVVAWVANRPAESQVYSSHRILEARTLAMHALIARKIERDTGLLSIAHRNIANWSRRFGTDEPAWLQEWRRILENSWPMIAAIITEPSEEGARLRQSSPFAGVLTPAERWRIYEAFRA